MQSLFPKNDFVKSVNPCPEKPLTLVMLKEDFCNMNTQRLQSASQQPAESLSFHYSAINNQQLKSQDEQLERKKRREAKGRRDQIQKRGKQTRMKEEKMTADSQSSIKSSTCCFNVIHSKEMLQLHDSLSYLLINSSFLFKHLHLPHSLHLHL